MNTHTILGMVAIMIGIMAVAISLVQTDATTISCPSLPDIPQCPNCSVNCSSYNLSCPICPSYNITNNFTYPSQNFTLNMTNFTCPSCNLTCPNVIVNITNTSV